ncbi:hypothetical protein D9736_02700 [Escherichia sp. E10V10]|nr:hypothetical protein D9736_02700 [Escherichia sp. E10V10]
MEDSVLIESDLWSRDTVECPMGHQERNGVKAAYVHKAVNLMSPGYGDNFSWHLRLIKPGYQYPFINMVIIISALIIIYIQVCF